MNSSCFIVDVQIGDIGSLLDEYDVEVDSPDGWVPVDDFIVKGDYEEYILTTESGNVIRCNANHLFETETGWMKASELVNTPYLYLGRGDKLEKGIVKKTDNIIPIVDISVNHPNHRYYSNGISSHNSGSGKSAFKCALAADFIRDGHDVLYITLELAEERVAERIDANLLNIPIAEVKKLSKDRYSEKFDSLKTKGYGKLVIKEYATGAASVNHFNLLMDELKQKKNFRPKIVFVDYLQIVASSRYKASSSINTYAMQKYVAEELRAFAMVHDVPVITSVQTNRSGFNVSDLDESNIADSAGIIHVLDFLGALIRDEQLKEEGKAIFKQIKNRWGDPTYYNKFAIGFDTSRMAVYNLETAEPANKEKSIEKIPSPTNNVRKPSKVDDWEF